MIEELKLKAIDTLNSLENILKEIDELILKNPTENYSVQVKAIDDSIKRMEKLGANVPEQLIQIKLELINKNDSLNYYSELKNSIIARLTEILPSSNNKNNNQPRQKNLRINGIDKTGYTGKAIQGFTFEEKPYKVNSWKDMFIKVCWLMYKKHTESFEEILNIQGKKGPFFSKSPKNLRMPEQIKDTYIYAETNLSANSTYTRAQRVLIHFGYNPNGLLIQTMER